MCDVLVIAPDCTVGPDAARTVAMLDAVMDELDGHADYAVRVAFGEGGTEVADVRGAPAPGMPAVGVAVGQFSRGLAGSVGPGKSGPDGGNDGFLAYGYNGASVVFAIRDDAALALPALRAAHADHSASSTALWPIEAGDGVVISPGDDVVLDVDATTYAIPEAASAHRP